MKDTLTVRLPARYRKELDEVSRKDGVKVSDLVRDSIRRYLAIRRFHEIRAIVVPYARARGILTDEDVFKLIS
jgi:metal-responsive CopG/Arc/MetJ family transcriptional regulator